MIDEAPSLSREFPGSAKAAARMWQALGGDADALGGLSFQGEGALPSRFAVTDLASGAWSVAALAVAELLSVPGGALPPVAIDRRLASMWFKWSLRPIGWNLPSPTEQVSGDYATADGWIRIHANGPRHRAAALSVLGVPEDKAQLVATIATLEAGPLETAIVAAGGCAAQMRSMEAWARHPQGKAIAAEPLIHVRKTGASVDRGWSPLPDRPLAGLKVLDLTRVLAGPMATRFLAGFGAQVLRLDPLDWDEGMVIPEVSLGKRCARIDLASDEGRGTFLRLLQDADVLVHGYRADALERLGLGDAVRHEVAPGLVDVRLNAYGWTGPWVERRGFDSLVQMSSGIAQAGMAWRHAAKPTPLPVQALDHATGYLMAAAAVRGLALRHQSGRGSEWRLSLARTARELVSLGEQHDQTPIAEETPSDTQAAVEHTPWGDTRRLKPPVALGGAPMAWTSGARALGSDAPEWL